MMKRLLTLFLAIMTCLSASAGGYVIKDINIEVSLRQDGSARFTEVWDVVAEQGTEWYLVKDNLDDIAVSGLSVSEEGEEFIYEGEWDTDRSISQKAGRCGIVTKRNGCEICWGIGGFGHHTFTVSYVMSNVVKSLNDYDMFHMQLVSPGLSANPEHVLVKIFAPDSLSEDNTGIWAFGYEGKVEFGDNGCVRMESATAFKSGYSVISLIRFNKGMFSPTSIREKNFDEVLDRALEGASFSDDYEDDGKGVVAAFFGMLAMVGLTLWAAIAGERSRKRKILGCLPKEVQWCRDVPFNGDVLQGNYVLTRLEGDRKANIAAALVLRMIMNGHILVRKDGRNRTELCFNDSVSGESLSAGERSLLAMMREASGRDLVLQKNEFRRWSARHPSRLVEWNSELKSEAGQRAEDNGNTTGKSFTVKGQSEARKTIGFRKYLKDFTLVNERESREVTLWKDYLVFAALYGIADKVAKELKEINPQAFEEVMTCDYPTAYQAIYLSRVMADSITNARVQHSATGASRGGFGGFSSIGGGGGFSGGGFGGGGR